MNHSIRFLSGGVLLSLASAASAAAPFVLYDTSWETAPASPAWTVGAVSPQNGWLSYGSPTASTARIRVIANGSADATVFSQTYTTPTGPQFQRFTASSSTTTENGQWAWPDLTVPFAGRPAGMNKLVASMDVLVPSGASTDNSVYGLQGYSDAGSVLDFGVLLIPAGQDLVLTGDGGDGLAEQTGSFPYNTWFKLAIQVDYDTGDLVVLVNGTPVSGLSAVNPLLVGSALSDVDLLCVNDPASPNPRVIFTDNFKVTVESNVSGPPANDNFASAFLISGKSGSTNGTTTAATVESGEPEHAALSPTASVWYQWTAPFSGWVTMDTLNASVDTVLAVYTGSSLATLNEVASNDDARPGSVAQSRASFLATAGTVYRIAVDTKPPTRGNFVLRWRPTIQLTAVRESNNHLTLGIQVAAPGFYEVQSSTALPTWATFDSVVFTDEAGGNVNYDAGDVSSPAKKFFRVIQ